MGRRVVLVLDGVDPIVVSPIVVSLHRGAGACLPACWKTVEPIAGQWLAADSGSGLVGLKCFGPIDWSVSGRRALSI